MLGLAEHRARKIYLALRPNCLADARKRFRVSEWNPCRRREFLPVDFFWSIPVGLAIYWIGLMCVRLVLAGAFIPTKTP